MTLILSVLSRFFMQWLMVLLALGGILMVFDLLANADNVLKSHPGELLPLWQYTGLRVQQILSFVLPLAVLIAAMALLARMVLSHEMVILHAVGIPVHAVLGVLAAATALIAFMHLAFANTLLPHSSATLYRWQQQDYRGKPTAGTVRVATDWVSDGNLFMRVGAITNHGRALRDIVLLERDEKNIIRHYLAADSAVYENGVWMMHGVREMSDVGGDSAAQTLVEEKRLPFDPGTLNLIGVREEELSYNDLLLLMDRTDAKDDTSRPYAFWFHRKLAYPFSSLIMLLIAAPIGLQLARRNRMLMVSFGCIMVGFLFYVLQQLLASLGETGLLPPVLAAWAPMVLGAVVGNWVLLHWKA
ncbi:MAG: LptF/LptG family permease [Alphaproteobacteria bacterium]|nr:LptF/LptG family permease [Alphaproteobacteria bacterium]